MNKLFKNTIIIFLAVFVYTGCQQPTGGFLGGDDGGGSNNFILLKPKRQLYSTESIFEDTFNRNTDFTAYIADNGPMMVIDPLDPNLKIEIISTIGVLGTEVNEEVLYSYDFTVPGRYRIIGTYNGKTDEYSVEVQGNFSDPGEGYDFAGIKWLD